MSEALLVSSDILQRLLDSTEFTHKQTPSDVRYTGDLGSVQVYSHATLPEDVAIAGSRKSIQDLVSKLDAGQPWEDLVKENSL